MLFSDKQKQERLSSHYCGIKNGMKYIATAIVFLLLSTISSLAQDFPFMRGGVEPPEIVVKSGFAKSIVKPGGYLSGSFFINIPKGWHIYALGEKKYHPLTFVNPSGLVTEARFSYPPAETIDILGEKVNVYQGKVEVIAEGIISPGAKAGPLQWRPRLTWQSCSDTVCLPPETKTLEVALKVSG